MTAHNIGSRISESPKLNPKLTPGSELSNSAVSGEREREREREMSNGGDEEAVEFEPEYDDLMDEDGDGGAQIPKLRSAITGKKTKGRGFREEVAPGNSSADRNTRLAARFDSLDSSGGPGPERSIEGWIILVTGVHEEAQEDNLQEEFGEFGEIKNLHLNLDRRTGFVKGYALIEYEHFEEAQEAINRMDGAELLTQTINVDWAFSRGPFKWKNMKKSFPRRQRSRSPRRKH